MLVTKDPKKPLAERSLVPCPHCHTKHPALKWNTRNNTGLGNWFGLYCDHCGGVIPCVWNLTSLLVLGIIFPIWIWFKKPLKKSWLSWQKRRFNCPMNLEKAGYNWPVEGMVMGCFMFLFMGLFYPWATKEVRTPGKVAFTLLWWLFYGLVYGYIMKIIRERAEKKDEKTSRHV